MPAVLALMATGCAGGGQAAGTATGKAAASTVTVASCGKDVRFPAGGQRVYVDAWRGLLSMTLAIGAQDRIAGYGTYDGDQRLLRAVHGDAVIDGLPRARKGDATVEAVVASGANVMVTAAGQVADAASNRQIAVYASADTCPALVDGGTASSWDTLYGDLSNLGKITDHRQDADTAINAIKKRLAALEAAPQAATPPTVFLFDRGDKNVYSSGSAGPVDRIISAAGGRNALRTLKTSWTSVSWEKLVSSRPDFIAFSDYPGQTVAQKIQVLKSNPATKDLPAVKEGRFLSLPVVTWVSSPLNADAAEHLRKSLEKWKLVPASDLEPAHALEP
ncbi:ABC transporter substrate-binding protein [Nonomuraea sp. NPDC050404]|uniref:ABC transporter substrate-binding protein n=1 Tax=Nonomuraea sp. NPDC050404 TaxID=3155783 RepID=UPI0033D6D6BA